MRIDQRLKRVQDLFLLSAEKDLETVTLDTEDVEVLLDLAIDAGEIKRENQQLLKRFDMISAIIKKAQVETKVDIGIEIESERIEFNNQFFGISKQINEDRERMETTRARFIKDLLK